MCQFTPPHAARQLRADLSFLPALWAKSGDMVLVDDVAAAVESVRHIGRYANDVIYVSNNDLQQHILDMSGVQIEAWGFNKSLVHQLVSINSTFQKMLPTEQQLEAIRNLSNRCFAAKKILPQLVASHSMFVGESRYFTGNASILTKQFAQPNKHFVLKAPWSSSGRGLRYVKNDYTSHVEGWCRNVIASQGGVMIEPLYNKVLDFGMEFMVQPDGAVKYLGLSIFSTIHGAYTGNVIATEKQKHSLLEKYIPFEVLDFLQNQLQSMLHRNLKSMYMGPLGVDMMIVRLSHHAKLFVHPCVEINFRRTMGHVALSLSPSSSSEPQSLMHILYTDKYHLKISLLEDDLCTPYI